MEKQEAIALWKKLKIESSTMEFSCGGDSMNDYSFTFYGKGKEIESSELNSYFEDAVFKNVEFYVNSDGHYQGEAGTVEITLDNDDDDFYYSKAAQSEYEEQHEEAIFISMPAPMIKFIRENISNINGSSENEFDINFKRDLILSDEQEELMEDIKSLLMEKVSEFEPKKLEVDAELNDYRLFTTGEGKLTIKSNSLKTDVTVRYTDYKDSD